MLSKCISALNIDPEGVYVDVTFGGGGHSLKILERIKGGRLIAFDQDEDARREAEKINYRSFTFCQANFKYMKKYLKLNQITRVNGILADLGVSSHQIDAPGRGFSTRFDGPLDMRMDVKGKVTAARVLNEYPEGELHKVFGMYGEVKNARTTAKMVVQARNRKRFERNYDLLEVLKPIAPRGKDFKYFAQVFQALRIEVNKEMEALESFLLQCGEVVGPGGRLVVISYHSLEDRLVKNYINTGKVHGELEKDFYGNPIRPFKAVNRKPIVAG
ncbi:MAG TPA: 16S rRNA (cytosine(1402)-N(4))-methyltransferase RsmH, partial [Cyclobacteriaceae bacterium]|nr:16S rRNA (cytosine(1402)-N(4))-methyltransferase RsmH [Cyclobacteriaceae bacterium]